jgi:nitroreductase/NAD-dependent dihydropyrimidine dehydrogenase PreA subunit
MVQVIINKEKCTGCGVCAEICPYRAIVLSCEKAEYIEECFLCGQCQAVCPVSAVELLNIPTKLGMTTIEEREEAIPPGTTNISELVALMRSRRSCRKYQNKAVERVMLEDLVRIGTTAPSGTNSQSWGFTIIPERSDLRILGGKVADYYRKLNRLAENPFLRLIVRIIGGDSLGRYYRRYYQSVSGALREWDEEGTDRLFHGASAAIMVTGSRQASCPAEDALLATQNILLAAHAMGLGSCLIGFVVEALRRDPKLKRLVGITENMEIYSIIALGYPAIKYYRPANRKIVVPRILKLRETDLD